MQALNHLRNKRLGFHLHDFFGKWTFNQVIHAAFQKQLLFFLIGRNDLLHAAAGLLRRNIKGKDSRFQALGCFLKHTVH